MSHRIGPSASERDFLAEIPSPSIRLWAGLCIILSIFIVFAVYSIHQIRWLEDFQINVVERNRKASIQLSRIQNDAYLIGTSLRDMTLKQAEYPIADWRAEFARLRGDMTNALELETQCAVNNLATRYQMDLLERESAGFWKMANHVFALAAAGRNTEARNLIETQLEGRDAAITNTVARLLVLNDQAQADAGQRISRVYDSFKKNNLVLLGVLLLLALATGLYTFQANRKTFERLSQLAQRLRWQSEQLRKLSWKLIDVQEETLRQVAHDLHDEFGQILTAIGIMLNRAGQKSPSSAMHDEIRKVKEIVEETLQNVRDRSQIFRPAILDDFGLGKTIEWLAGQFSRQTGIIVHLECTPSEVLFPGEDAIHIYRIVQEALSNVARHSGAEEAWVVLERCENELKVEIRDAGKGFSPGGEMNQAAGEGFGLMGMRERARRLKGALTIESAPGKGTRIEVRIPINASQPEPVAEKVK